MSNIAKNELVVAWIALGVTLLHALVGAIFYLKGSEVVVSPRTLLLFVQEGPRGSTLSAALELTIVNRSRWYGDALIGAHATLGGEGELASHEAFIFPRFAARCPENPRCVQYRRLAVEFMDEDVVPVPNLGAKIVWISFHIPCQVLAPECDPNRAYDAAEALDGNRWSIQVNPRFVDEGDLPVRCIFGPVSFARLRHEKWMSFNCESESAARDG